jgi:hypothetical protein
MIEAYQRENKGSTQGTRRRRTRRRSPGVATPTAQT